MRDNPIDNIRIAILFHDCDMTSTYEALLHLLVYSFEYTLRESDNPFLKNDKENALKVINKALLPIHRIAQDPYGSDNSMLAHKGVLWSDEFMTDYLEIKPDKLLLGEEVDEYVKDTSWNNGEDYILDMRLPKDQRIFRI
jgi:hypothetical protein